MVIRRGDCVNIMEPCGKGHLISAPPTRVALTGDAQTHLIMVSVSSLGARGREDGSSGTDAICGKSPWSAAERWHNSHRRLQLHADSCATSTVTPCFSLLLHSVVIRLHGDLNSDQHRLGLTRGNASFHFPLHLKSISTYMWGSTRCHSPLRCTLTAALAAWRFMVIPDSMW